MTITRRAFVVAGAGGVGLVAGCANPLPIGASLPASDAAAERLLQASAEAHGLEAYRRLHDISVRYEGEWRPIVGSIQPDVVDAGFRGGSEERLLPGRAIVAQAYKGPAGSKQVVWRRDEGTPAHPGDVAVWRNGVQAGDNPSLDAAALVAEGYGLFLLGPLWLAERGLVCERGGQESVDGRACEIVRVWMRPGLGRSALDRAALSVDAASGLTRRIRFTLEGTVNTRGAVAQVDTFEHQRRFGITWPMRSYEEVLSPVRLPAHDWRITGLDVDRGFDASAISGASFSGLAAAPARPL